MGGPFPTSVPEFALSSGAHYLILDEGESTIPFFVDALQRGEQRGIFRATEKPDVTQTPIPRFDLLDLDAYITVNVQFSRGCPLSLTLEKLKKLAKLHKIIGFSKLKRETLASKLEGLVTKEQLV